MRPQDGDEAYHVGQVRQRGTDLRRARLYSRSGRRSGHGHSGTEGGVRPRWYLFRNYRLLITVCSFYRHDEFYPDGAVQSPDLSHIISKPHFDRIKGLLDRTSGTIAFGGETDESRLFIAPTVIKGVKGDDSLMSE